MAAAGFAAGEPGTKTIKIGQATEEQRVKHAGTLWILDTGSTDMSLSLAAYVLSCSSFERLSAVLVSS